MTDEKQQNLNNVISPDRFNAVLFDMDGVVTRTATVHFSAWKKTFDEFLKSRGGEFQEFTRKDYLEFVDGKPREDGVQSFIDSRKIELQQGAADDKPGIQSVAALAKKKDEEFLRLIHSNGVEPYESTVALIKHLREAGIKIALVTASKNGEEILRVTKLAKLFDATVTGIDTQKLNLKGKPNPDTFLEAAKRLDVDPEKAVVVEDAEAGVTAGSSGGFGLVIGVARQNNEKALKEHGADVVVSDLGEISLPDSHTTNSCGMAMVDLDVTKANWIVSYDRYDSESEQRRESLCTLGNGVFFTRGAFADADADGTHYPATYFAGGYNSIELNSEDGPFSREELVNMPNWLCLKLKIEDGPWINIDDVEILEFSQRLNLLEGILYREITLRDKEKRETKIDERRFVHMQHSQLAGIEITVTPINWSGSATIRSAIDATVTNNGDKADQKSKNTKHLKTLTHTTDGDEIIVLKAITSGSGLIVAQAARTQLWNNNSKLEPARKEIIENEYIGQDISVDLQQGQPISIQKTVALHSSRDNGIYEAEEASREAVANAPPFADLIESQIDAWRSLWHQFDLFIETTEENSKLIPSLLLHLNSFHCLQTASANIVDLDSGIPARGWTGEGYQGHVFWDDLFVFPYINLRMPDISAALLKYRYRRLHHARKIARSYGARGACFPWQSASDGRERTPNYWYMETTDKWIRDYTHLEIHVNCAIAYNVWQYFQVTADNQFMHSFGAEILLEIARFFASFAKYDSEKDRYEIHGVIGPDEFHNGYPNSEKPGVNNNAYTNIMASWTLCRALELLDTMPSDHSKGIRSRLKISDEEIDQWNITSKKMFVPLLKNGLIAQFEGYDQLEEFPGFKDRCIDPDQLRKALDENLGYLNQYKISKQPDVLMLGFLFSPEELNDIVKHLGLPTECASLRDLADYYVPRTANQSTLSRVAITWVLSRVDRLAGSDRKSSTHIGHAQERKIFYEALGSDYFDVAARGTAKSGIHMGAMAGTIDIVQRCYTGIVMRDDVLWLDPILPEELVRLSFTLYYRGQSLNFDIHRTQIKISARHSSANPIMIGYKQQVHELNAGESVAIPLLQSHRNKRESV